MKGRIIVSKFWTELLSGRRAAAITIFPFILLRNKSLRADRQLLNHERIHLAQALELLIIPFYLVYLLEFSLRYFYYRDFKKAYLSISFEKEAYKYEGELNYLAARPCWAFVKFI